MTAATAVTATAVTNQGIYYIPFVLPVTITLTVLKMRIGGGGSYTGQNNNLYAAIYDCGADGAPNNLLRDYGVLGTANQSFQNAATIVASAAAASLTLQAWTPYYLAVHAIWTAGGTGTPSLTSLGTADFLSGSIIGSVGFVPAQMLGLTGNATAAFANPATAPTLTTNTGIFVALLAV